MQRLFLCRSFLEHYSHDLPLPMGRSDLVSRVLQASNRGIRTESAGNGFSVKHEASFDVDGIR